MLNNGLLQSIYSFCFSIIAGSLIVIMITNGIHNTNSTYGSIGGYGASTFSMVVITLLAYLGASTSPNINLYMLTITMLPYIAIIGLFIYSFILLTRYANKISSNKVPNNYSLYSYSSIILLLVQVGLLYKFINGNYYKENNIISNVNSLFLIVLNIINYYLLVSLGLEMKYFVTDG